MEYYLPTKRRELLDSTVMNLQDLLTQKNGEDEKEHILCDSIDTVE